jgi:hypothetical protein
MQVLNSNWQWTTASSGMKLFCVVCIAGWCVFMVALMTTGVIEAAALSQPSTADLTYVHPHMFKGTVHYLTENQDRIYSISRPAIPFAFVSVFSLWMAFYWLNRS